MVATIFEIVATIHCGVCGMKKCLKCGISKKEIDFNKRKKGSKDGLQSYCKECTKNAFAEYPRKSHYLIEYGISQKEYSDLYELQQGKCAICHTEKDKLFVDHDHRTGRIRELLCNKCNAGLGYFSDNKEFIKRAYMYIRKHEDINDVKELLNDIPDKFYSTKRKTSRSRERGENA